jgi:hypothetical protein
MKKAGKITLYVIGVILTLVILLVLFRNEIIGYALKKVISNRSEESVTLVLESFHFDMFSGDIVVEHPVLMFTDLYMSEQKNIKIDKIVYAKLVINGLDLKSLIFHGDIIAHRFLIDKPEFWLVEHGTEKKSSFHPEKLIRTLNQNPGNFSKINIKIAVVEIHYGSIKLSESALPDVDQGLVDFTIILRQFDTHPDSLAIDNRVLYSEEFKLKLRNLKKELQSGYILEIDSAVFSSKQSDLIITGASLLPGAGITEKNKMGIKAGRLAFNDIGLNEIRGLEDLNLSSVEISDGVFFSKANENSDKNINPEKPKGANELIKILYDFRLDSISVNNFDYYNIGSGKDDTLIALHRIDFLITDLKIDSTMISDLFWHLHYNNIRFHTGPLSIRKLIPGYLLKYDSFSYTNEEKHLHLENIYLVSDTTAAGRQPETKVLIPVLEINGLSMKRLQKRAKQHLNITLLNPGGDLDITSLAKKDSTKAGKILFPGYLLLDKIELSGGHFHVVNKGMMEAGVDNLHLILTKLHLPEAKNDSLHFKHVSIQYDNSSILWKDNPMSVTTGPLTYEHGRLSLKEIFWKKNTTGGHNSLQLNAVNITGFDRVKLMHSHKLVVDSLVFSEPRLSGDFVINDKSKAGQQGSFGQMVIPYTFQVNHLAVKNGRINQTGTYKDEPVRIKTGYNLKLWDLMAEKDDSLKSVLNRIRWYFELTELKAEALKHSIKINYLLTDSYGEVLRLNNLAVSYIPEAEADTDKITFRSMIVPSINVSGLDYSLLMMKDSLNFDSLQIKDPYIDMVLPAQTGYREEQEEDNEFRPRDYLVFGYQGVELDNLNLKIEKKGPDNNEHISLKKFDFGHFKDSGWGNNLIDDLVFNFEEFSFYDSISNKHVHINKGMLDSDKGTLFIQGVKGSNAIFHEDGSIDLTKPGISLNSRDIELSGITIGKTLPTHISAGKLKVEDIILDIVQQPSDTSRREDLKVDLDIMKKLENLLTSMQLDTALLSDINFNIHSLGDTAEGLIKIDSIGMFVEKLHVDSSMVGEIRPNIINRITIDLKGNTQITKDSLYELRTGKLHYNFREQKITIDSFYITPLFEPEEFFRRSVYQTDRIDFFSPKLEIDHIDLNELLSEKHLHISNVNLYNAQTEMYRDKHYPLKPGIYKPLPRELLSGIKKAFTIDSVHIIDSYLKYLEMDAKADDPGEVYFDRFNITAYNLTSRLKEGEKKDLIIDLHTRIMGQSMMDLNIRFPLYPDTIAFRMTGKTEKIDLTSLNPLTRNLLGIGITKGKGRVDISYISGNDSVAKGALIFKYKKLRLLPYNRKKEKLRKNVLTPLVSFMINDLVVKSNNPRFARKPRVGEVYFKRDTQKSIVNYVWKSVLSGLMSTMGFNNRAQRQERKEERKK